MNQKILSCLLIGCSFFCSISGSASETRLELLPKGRLFRLTFLDPREIRMAINFEGNSRIHAKIGNYFSLFAISPDSDKWQAHFGIEGAGYFTMRKEGTRFPLETADGLIGVYTDVKSGPWQGQIRFTHISAHLADGLPLNQAIAFSREFLAVRVGYATSDYYHLYGGLSYLVNSTPALPSWSLQGGGVVFFPLINSKMVPYTGMDLRWKGDTPQNPSASLQAGIALNNPPDAYRSFRFYYSYVTGADPRGQYFNQNYTSHSLGIEMQI